MPDIRSSLNIKFVDKLVNIGLSPFIHDPFPQTNADIHTGTWGELHDIDICIIMLKHQQYIKMGFNAFIHCCNPKGVIMDIGNCFLDAEKPNDIRYWNL